MCWCIRCCVVRIISLVMVIIGFCIDTPLGVFAVVGALLLNVFMEILNDSEKGRPRTKDGWPLM